MSAESPEQPSNYHDRVAAMAAQLADTLEVDGLESALTQAQQAADDFDHDYRYLMNAACSVLFQTEDPALQEPGLGYLTWEAEHFPNDNDGNDIAWNAKYDARYDESREFARRCFEISLMHFRFAAQAEGFVANDDFFDNLTAALARMDEEGFDELYEAGTIEFTPLAITAATDYQRDPDAAGSFDEYKFRLDNLLATAVHYLHESDPETAARAQALITDELVIKGQQMNKLESAIIAAYADNDFAVADELLKTTETRLFFRLWDALRDRVAQGRPEDLAWASRVLDSIKASGEDGNYFRETATRSMDFYLGPDAGKVIGILGRTDIIDDLMSHQAEEPLSQVCFLTITGIIYGLGKQRNEAVYDQLMAQLPNLSDKLIDSLRAFFQAGLDQASPSAQ